MMSIARRSARRMFGVVGVLAGLLGGPSGVGAQMPQSISVIVFPGGFNWPIWVAQQKGYFAQNGIEVKLTNTPNSVFQLTGLIEGRFDVAMTAIDNVVAYMEGQGEAKVDRQPDKDRHGRGEEGARAAQPLWRTEKDPLRPGTTMRNFTMWRSGEY
jgi:ABC-type nitrate/sulfonate/bicarbonate transport system substrate-binding protein